MNLKRGLLYVLVATVPYVCLCAGIAYLFGPSEEWFAPTCALGGYVVGSVAVMRGMYR